MMTAEAEAGLIRPQVVALVAKLRADGLSTMGAYEALGGMVGKSDTWVRKVVGRSPDVAIRLRDALSVTAAYRRLCTSIEAAADDAAANNALLREELHAAVSSHRPAARGASGRAPAAGATARRPGRSAASTLVRSSAAPGVPAAADPSLNDLPLWRALNEGE
ncbi:MULTISPECIES: hypothetical protein [unclassified Methylobacterium]|uniref:hypothetical protein n=1 Tax=unclassified Methylobacterium TaxID=2615210 RepID=UPI001FEDA355|nr:MULTISPECIES: hypothetical protein [unclassified Methylobacterium]